MAKDAELDRLKAEKDLAFQRKQDAYQAQQCAWEERSSAREEMNRAFDAKQRAYVEQERAWWEYQNARTHNGPRIDSLNAKQEKAYQNMIRAFDNASSAHERGDDSGAASCAARGHRYEQKSKGYVTERRRLVEEIRSARGLRDKTKAELQQAKDEFSRCRDIYDSARADNERAVFEFKRAKQEFDLSAEAFRERLEKVKTEGQKRREDKKSIAAKAGVPLQYRDNVWVSTDRDGNTNIYFGGVGKPNGQGHGHYVMDRNDNVTYRRDPFDPHGRQNFEKADLYMRSARSDHEPLGTNENGGVFYRRDDDGSTVLHVTQYFADNYHVSWDATPHGNSNVHWTNKNVPNGHHRRFVAPPDALFT